MLIEPMTNIDDSLPEVIERLESGDEAAAKEIFKRFASRLINLAHKRLNDRLGNKIDAEDVVQSVFRSFFVRQQEQKYSIANWNSLWGLLAKITLRKCHRQSERHFSMKRDVRQEANQPGSPIGSQFDAWEAATREPTPDEVAIFEETVNDLFATLDEFQSRVIELKLQGYSVADIREQTNATNERKVYRVLESVKEYLETQIDEQKDS